MLYVDILIINTESRKLAKFRCLIGMIKANLYFPTCGIAQVFLQNRFHFGITVETTEV